ncbi:MAG: hypothetical protein HY329_25510 [Chloroflexi bacterium]|nr:hypothetical protein [Chloroflexota bacterium]
MTSTVRIISPVGIAVPEQHQTAPRIPSFEGRSVALLDNMKSNGDVLLDRLGANLRRELDVTAVKRFRKPITSGQSFSPEVIDEIRQHYDVAIAAIGD